MGRSAVRAGARHSGLLKAEDPLHLTKLGVGVLQRRGALDDHVDPDLVEAVFRREVDACAEPVVASNAVR